MITQKRNPKEAQAKLEHQELRAVRHPTNIDKIRNAVPPAVNVLPENSLPGWKNYPLEKKFPRVPANKNQFVFGRNAIGEKIFVSGCNFDLDDPHMQATPRGYESLHDPNLKSYFLKHPDVFEKLVEHGFVERDGSVNTTLKEFNTYRAYLGRMRNCVVEGDLGYRDGLAKQQRNQMKRILETDKREKGRAKDEVKARHLAALKRQAERKQLRAQLKDTKFFQRVKEKEREAAINAVKREAMAQKVRARLAKLRKAERRRVRRILLEWYCRQLYADMMRKALMEHKKQVREKDLDSFVKAKREFQQIKMKWLDNLREKRDAERECAGNHRRQLFDKMEDGRRERMKKKALEVEFQAMKEIYLAKKFGKRWLNYVRQQRKYAQNYHDSVWRVRQQLVQMVQELRNESGRVNFHSFITGLIKMKPGRDSVDISDETREIMNYILDLLIKTAFDTYRKNKKACDKAYENLHNRRRILGVKDLTEDDFKEPPFQVREKVHVPFERPYLPCDHVCTKIGNRRYVEDPECEEERERLRMLRQAEELACEEIDRVCGKEMRGRGFGKGKKRGVGGGKKRGVGGGKMHDVGRKGDQSSDSSAVAERVSKGALKKGIGRVMTATSGDSSDVARRVVTKSVKKAVSDLACDEDEGEGVTGSNLFEGEWGGEGVGEKPRTGVSGDSSEVARKVVSQSLLRAFSDLACPEDGDEWGGEGYGEVPRTGVSGDSSDIARKVVSRSMKNAVSELACDEDEEWGGECDDEGEWGGERECEDGGEWGGECEDEEWGREDGVPGSEVSGVSDEAAKLVTSSLIGGVSGLGDEADTNVFEGEWGGEGVGERPTTGLSGDSSDAAGKVVSESLLKAVSDLACDDEDVEWDGEGEGEDGGGKGLGDSVGKPPPSGRSEGVTSSSGSSGGADKVVSESLRKAVSDLSCPEDEEGEDGVGRERVGDGVGKPPPSGRSEGATSSSGSSGRADKVVAESLRKAVSDLACPEDGEGEDEDGGDEGGLGGEGGGLGDEDGGLGGEGGGDEGGFGGEDKENEGGLAGEGESDKRGDKGPKSTRSEKSTSGSSGETDKVVADSLRKAVSDLSCPEDEGEDDQHKVGSAESLSEDKGPKSARSEKSSSGSSGADKVVADSLRKAVSDLSCPDDEEDDGALAGEDDKAQKSGRSEKSSSGSSGGVDKVVAESLRKAVSDLSCPDDEEEYEYEYDEDHVPPLTAIEREDWLRGQETGRSTESSEEAKSLVAESVKCAVDDLGCEEEGSRGKSGSETGRSSGSSEEAKSLVMDSLKCAVGDLECEERDEGVSRVPESRGDGPGEIGESGKDTGRSSGSSEEAKSLVADSLKCAVGDLACEEQEAQFLLVDTFGERDERGDGPGGIGESGLETGRSSGSSADAKSLVADSLKCAVGDLECEEDEEGGEESDRVGEEPKSGRSEGTTSSSWGSDGAKGVVEDSLRKAVSDLSCPEEDEEDEEEDGRDGEGVADDSRNEPDSGRSEGVTSSSGASDGANRAVEDSLRKAVSDLSCPEEDEEEEFEHGTEKEPDSGRSEGVTSSSGASDGVNGVVQDSLKKAVSDLSCPEEEEEDGPQAGEEGVGDSTRKEPDSGRSEGVTSSSGASDGANGVVEDSLKKAVSDLSCPEDDKEEDERAGEGVADDSGKEPDSGRSEGLTSSSGASDGANGVVEDSLKKAVSDLSCPEEDEEEDGRAGEGVADDSGKEPDSGRSEGVTSSSGASDGANGVVEDSLKRAVSDLSCIEDDEEEECQDEKGVVGSKGPKDGTRDKATGKESKSGRSEGNSSNGSSGGATEVVENSLRNAISDLSCVADDEEDDGKECAEVEQGCEEDDDECVGKVGDLEKWSSEVIPGAVLSAVTSEEAENIVSSSLRNAVSDLACDEEGEGGSGGVEQVGRGIVGDGGGVEDVINREGGGSPDLTRGSGGGSAQGSPGTPGSQGSSHHDDCSSLLDVMAKEIAFSVLPQTSVSSGYFREPGNERTYSGPVFPLEGTEGVRSVGEVETRGSAGRETRGIASQPASGSRTGAGSGTRPGSGSGSRPGSGSAPQPVAVRAPAPAPSGTTPPRVPSRPGSAGSGSQLPRRLPSDMRENVLRTLSNVQHQLDAIRQELRNYGVIPRGSQGGNPGGS